MELPHEVPHVKAHSRDGSWWWLAVESGPAFLAAWKGGQAFWSGTALYGDTVHIKLADIVGVTERSANGIVLEKEQKDAEKRRELTEGA